MKYEEIQVGMRVRMDSMHADFLKFEHQHEGYEGTVVTIHDQSDYMYDYNVGVTWDNGYSGCSYKHQSLIPVEEVKKVELRVGMRVRPNPSHRMYEAYYSQHANNKGTILDMRENLRIKWDNGHINYYNNDYVLPVEYDENGIEIIPAVPENPFAYLDKPILPGMRIALNPNHTKYSMLLVKIEGTNGTLVNPQLSDDVLKPNRWIKESINTRKGFSATVLFDNGKKINVTLSQIIPVDEPNRNVYCLYSRELGEDKYIFAGNPDLDKYLITQADNYEIQRIYDEDWRKNILK